MDKYTNYNYYIIDMRTAKKVDTERLEKVIEMCKAKLKQPYIRFMYAGKGDEALCVLYDGEQNLTKLVTFTEVEQFVKALI